MGYVRAVALTGSDQVVKATQSAYAGLVVRETAGSTAEIRVYNHPSAALGTLIASYALAANASVTVSLNCPVWCELGIWVDVVSGAVAGSVFIA